MSGDNVIVVEPGASDRLRDLDARGELERLSLNDGDLVVFKTARPHMNRLFAEELHRIAKDDLGKSVVVVMMKVAEATALSFILAL